MVYGTSDMEYSCGDAGMRSKILANHGMYGAYPAFPDRSSYAHGTNVKQLIEDQKPLVHERGDPETPTIDANITYESGDTAAVAPFVTPELLGNYDIIVHPVSGAQAMGDPITRDPALIEEDLNKGWTSARVAGVIAGAVVNKNGKGYEVDRTQTEAKRKAIREERKTRAVPFKEWWAKEREKVAAGENMDEAVLAMWRSSMALSPEYGAELRAFWNLPEDFTF